MTWKSSELGDEERQCGSKSPAGGGQSLFIFVEASKVMSIRGAVASFHLDGLGLGYFTG